MTAREALWGNPPTWLYDAEDRGITPACRGVDPDLFFPEVGPGHNVTQHVAEAKAVCATCPLLTECHDWATSVPPEKLYGVWGGTTRNDRLASKPRGPQPPQLRKSKPAKENA